MRRKIREKTSQKYVKHSGLPIDVRIEYHLETDTRTIEAMAILRDFDIRSDRKYIGIRLSAEMTG
jgi:hypothetical protein